MTYVMARFRDAPLGLPLPGSPQILRQATMSRPHPSGEGRGRLGSLLGMLVIVPISLIRGEGQTVGRFVT